MISSHRLVLRRALRYQRTFKTATSVKSELPPLVRPGPPPLPPKEQREFEELVKSAATPAASATSSTTSASKSSPPSLPNEDEVHPDARRTPAPEFLGDVNPVTGEKGGPKREPVRHNDWSHSGRVTDF